MYRTAKGNGGKERNGLMICSVEIKGLSLVQEKLLIVLSKSQKYNVSLMHQLNLQDPFVHKRFECAKDRPARDCYQTYSLV